MAGRPFRQEFLGSLNVVRTGTCPVPRSGQVYVFNPDLALRRGIRSSRNVFRPSL